MLLTVSHQTRYTYDRAVRGVVQSHRLTPSAFQGQKVLAWQVMVSDGMQGGSFRDGAGDLVQSWTVRGPVGSILVQVQGQVETTDLAGILKGHRETVPPEAYLRESDPTRADQALLDLGQVAEGAADALEAAHRLSAAIGTAIAYQPGATHAATTAAEALALKAGVCQDHAHALIAAARGRAMAARYVSGYLHSAADGAAHEAAHAWAEIWVKGLGWVGFDPANACCPDERYIRLGSGLDAVHAAPIKGIARGGAVEHLDVTLAVLESSQQ